MTNDRVQNVLISFVICLVGLAAILAIRAEIDARREYREVCKRYGGQPAYDGVKWVCLKEEQ